MTAAVHPPPSAPHVTLPADPKPEHLINLLLTGNQEYAVALLDLEGRVTTWLGASEDIFGYAADEALGRHIAFLFEAEDRALEQPRYELEVAAATGRAHDDRWHLRKDGSRIWVSGSVSPLLDDAGQHVGYGKIMRDRTDLRTRIETLENRVASLQAMHRRVEGSISTLGHEMRNPVGVLSAGIALLRRSSGAPDPRHLDLMDRQLALLTRLSSDLMDMSRLDADKLSLHRERLDLCAFLHDVTGSLQERAAARGVRARAILPPRPIHIQADPARLQQIVLNLLDNALKYTDAGGRVWLKASLQAGDVLISVRDTGIGISADMLPRIFELFTQDAEAARHAPGGLGIGLALVRQLVELHGGEVLVTSRGPGKGSEFTVRLPLDGESAPQGAAAQH